MCHCSQLDVNNNNLLYLIFFFTLFSINTNNCSLDLYNEGLQITIIIFTHNASSHQTDRIFTDESCWTKMALPSQNLSKCKQHIVYIMVACDVRTQRLKVCNVRTYVLHTTTSMSNSRTYLIHNVCIHLIMKSINWKYKLNKFCYRNLWRFKFKNK